VAAEFAIKKLGVKKAATIHDGSVYAEQLQAVFARPLRKWAAPSQPGSRCSDGHRHETRAHQDRHGQTRVPVLSYLHRVGRHITDRSRKWPVLRRWPSWGRTAFSPLTSIRLLGHGDRHVSFQPGFLRFCSGYKDFLAKHSKKYGEKPLAPFHAHGYDAAMLIFNAIKKVGKAGPDGTLYIGRKALRDALLRPRTTRA